MELTSCQLFLYVIKSIARGCGRSGRLSPVRSIWGFGLRSLRGEAVNTHSDSISALRGRFIRDELRAALYHDVRNDLAVIRNASSYLVKGLGAASLGRRAEPKLQLMVELIDAQASVALRRLELEVGRPDESKTSLHVLLTSTARRFPSSAILAAHPPADVTLAGNSAELQIALACLVDNALDAAEAADEKQIGVEAQFVGARRLELAVLDTGLGLGVPQTDAMRRFFTTKEGRLGLGLNVSARIARRCGGRLELRDNGGQGCRAVLVLAVAR